MANHHFICIRLLMFLMICSCCKHILAANQSQFFTEMKKSFFSVYMRDWDTANATSDFCSYRGVRCIDQGNVDMIDFSGWWLNGSFPEDVCQYLPQLKILRLGYNDLNGRFPVGITNCSLLEKLVMSRANLSGTLPDLSPLQSLKLLDLSGNSFYQEFPRSLNMTSLIHLDFSSNFLVGQLPPEMGQLKILQMLYLSHNQLEGEIPQEFGNMIELTDLDISGNKLTKFPEALLALPHISSINLSNNCLNGSIPRTIGNAKNLSQLLLYNNLISGFLPVEIVEAINLVNVDLCNNLLSGPIPPEIGNLRKLQFLSLSGNNFTGCIPVGISSNPNLLNWPHPNLYPCLQTYNKKTSRPILSIGLPLLFYSFVVGLILFRWLWFKKGKAITEKKDAILSSFFGDLVDSCHDEIIRSMIDGNIVGRGGYGTVYKIELSNAITVAVKKLQSDKSEASESVRQLVLDKELKAEVDTLGSIRHRNIVKLYCYFSSAERNLLVYEFMPNGNLWDALHKGNALLNWPIRYKIALGAAQGLAHLHHHHPAPIIHRDIKSSNILLDSEYNPKVGDFGLAKILEERRGKQSISTGAVAGTFGYLDPEYALKNRASIKSDVYSFGVVLMELVTGRKPVEIQLFEEGNNIIDWIRNKVVNKEAGLEVLDQRISESFEDGMLKVLLLSMNCTHAKKASRPTMDEVVEMLIRAADPVTSNEQIRNIQFTAQQNQSDTLPTILVTIREED